MAGLTLPVGTQLGGYVLGGVLGQGASGTVYKAQDADGLEVALKLLHPAVAADPASRQRLRREVGLLQRVKSTCVARVVDAEIDQAEAFVVTELIDGVSVEADLRQHGPWPIERLAQVAQDLTQAVATIHGYGVVHRDLKPSNVMLRRDGSAVLIDFGLAQEDAWTRLTGTGLVAGTPGFVAPELLRGGTPGPEADRWAAAALLLSAATARPPYGTGAVEATLSRALDDDPDTDGLPDQVAALFRSAVLSNPDRRLPLEDLSARLARVAAGLPAWEVPDAAEPETLIAPAPWDQPTDGQILPSATRPLAEALPPVYPPGSTDQPTTVAGHQAWPDADYPGPEAPTTYGPAEPSGWPSLPTPPVEPAGAPFTYLALWLGLTSAGTRWPVAVAVVAAVWLWLGRTVYLGRQSVWQRRMRTGGRGPSAAHATVTAPWWALRGLVGQIPAAALALAVGVGGYLLVTRLDLDLNLPVALVGGAACAVGLLLAWSGPSQYETRSGCRTLTRALLPTAWARALLVVALVAAAALLVWPLVP